MRELSAHWCWTGSTHTRDCLEADKHLVNNTTLPSQADSAVFGEDGEILEGNASFQELNTPGFKLRTTLHEKKMLCLC